MLKLWTCSLQKDFINQVVLLHGSSLHTAVYLVAMDTQLTFWLYLVCIYHSRLSTHQKPFTVENLGVHSIGMLLDPTHIDSVYRLGRYPLVLMYVFLIGGHTLIILVTLRFLILLTTSVNTNFTQITWDSICMQEGLRLSSEVRIDSYGISICTVLHKYSQGSIPKGS